MLPRRLFPWLFVLSLLFGQAAAFAHGLTHLRTHDPAVPDKVCEVCVAHAQLGSAAPPSLFTLTLPSGVCIRTPGAMPVCADLAPSPACARAPPAPPDV
ncbi:MAG: hypothetical protein ACYCZA_00365 [Thiobacillus sp.]